MRGLVAALNGNVGVISPTSGFNNLGIMRGRFLAEVGGVSAGGRDRPGGRDLGKIS